MHRLALQTFRQMYFSIPERFDMGYFRHGEFSAPEHFGTGIFRHLNISAHGYFGTLQSNMDVSAQTFRHLCYCAEMSMCQNVPVPKCPWCRKILVPKSPDAKKFLYQNVYGDEMSMCRNTYRAESWTIQNVPVMKCLCRSVSGWNVFVSNWGGMKPRRSPNKGVRPNPFSC